MTKDFYKILGVTEFDSADNIKVAYRRLARKLHPDIAGNSTDALRRFKEINEAYETLSNPIKKEEYDRARRFYSYAQNNFKSQDSQATPKNSTNPKNKNFNFSWDEFLNKKNRTNSYKKEEAQVKKGEDIYSDIEINLFEALDGCTKTVNMLQTQACPKCKGHKFVNGSLCQNCLGKGSVSDYKKFNIKIPAGIKNKSKIRLAGEGAKGTNGGKNGDLYITVHIKETQNYKNEGLNILKTITIAPFEAVLGADIKVSVNDAIYNVKIAPKTQNGQKIRLAGCGLVQNGKFGDMILTVEIQIPKNLTPEEFELYKKLSNISKESIRDNFYDR